MTIQKIQSKEVWEQFMSEVHPQTFLQSWNWGVFNQQTGHTIWRLGVYDGQTLVASALVIRVTARRGSFLFIPHGPIIRDGVNASSVITELSNYLAPIAKEQGCVFIRISPLLKETPEHTALFKAAAYRPAAIHMMHPELSWTLDLSPSEDQLLAGMRKTTRYSIKKADKDGVTVRMSKDPADLATFQNIYQKTVKRQDFKAFPNEYFIAEFEAFRADDEVALFFAEYQGKVTGVAYIVFYGDSAFYHHGATTREFPSITDAQAIQWAVIKEAKRRGKKLYNFWGVVPESATRHPWHGLSLFKRGFGGYEQQYVHAQDLVLSPRYLVTYVVERARKIKRGL